MKQRDIQIISYYIEIEIYKLFCFLLYRDTQLVLSLSIYRDIQFLCLYLNF